MQLVEQAHRELHRTQLIWAYRAWALELNARTGPELLQYLNKKSGFLPLEDIQQILALVTNHCVIASLSSSYAVAANLGSISEVGREFSNSVDELNHTPSGDHVEPPVPT